MKTILLSILLSFVVLAESSAMQKDSHPTHKSVIEMFEDVSGFGPYFAANFLPHQQVALRKLFALDATKGQAHLPSLYELIFRDNLCQPPVISEEGVPIGFPGNLLMTLNDFPQFTYCFKMHQTAYLCQIICFFKKNDAHFTWAKLQEKVMALYHECNTAIVGPDSYKCSRMLGFYLLFRRPDQTFARVRKYLLTHNGELHISVMSK